MGGENKMHFECYPLVGTVEIIPEGITTDVINSMRITSVIGE